MKATVRGTSARDGGAGDRPQGGGDQRVPEADDAAQGARLILHRAKAPLARSRAIVPRAMRRLRPDLASSSVADLDLSFPSSSAREREPTGARREGETVTGRRQGDEEDLRQDRGRSESAAEHGADHRRGLEAARRGAMCVLAARLFHPPLSNRPDSTGLKARQSPPPNRRARRAIDRSSPSIAPRAPSSLPSPPLLSSTPRPPRPLTFSLPPSTDRSIDPPARALRPRRPQSSSRRPPVRVTSSACERSWTRKSSSTARASRLT